MTGAAHLQDEPYLDERYQRLVELAPDGILIHDGGRVVLANAAAIKLAGATSSTQVVGQPIDAFLDPPHLKAVETELTHPHYARQLAAPVLDSFRRLDGSLLAVEIRAVGFVDRGRPSAHLVIRDISNRLAGERRAQEAQEHRSRALRMESVSALAGGVAQEINNMMQVALGFGDILVHDVTLPPLARTAGEQIVRAAERAAAMTRELLAFSRRGVNNPEIIDLARAIRAAEPLVTGLLGELGRLVLATDEAPVVRIDPDLLRRMIVDLALNARDAMPNGGTLTITTALTELADVSVAADGSAISPGRYGGLIVHDTGTGIEPSTLLRIFEPFFTTKPTGHGMGLSLAAIRGSLAQNRGHITVSSALGHGTTFTVLLPVVADADLAVQRAPPPTPVSSGLPPGRTVLVVDDEPAVRAVAALILERSGLHVIQAAGGLEAFELLKRHGRPDLVLTDLVMPGTGGIELARRLRTRWPALPILFMSGYSVDELAREDAADCGHPLIEKPFKAGALVAAVTALLSVRRTTGGAW